MNEAVSFGNLDRLRQVIMYYKIIPFPKSITDEERLSFLFL